MNGEATTVFNFTCQVSGAVVVFLPQDTNEAPPAAEDEGEELIEITHGEEGTSIRIEDVSTLELAALIVIGLVVVSVAFGWWRHRRRVRGQHYSLDDRTARNRRDRRLP